MNIETEFDLLRHPHRRAVVSILDETDSISRQELVARLAADADDEDPASANESDARTMEIALHHNHLPRLDDAGVVEYDDDAVTATPQLETVVEYATLATEDPENTRYRLDVGLSRFYA